MQRLMLTNSSSSSNYIQKETLGFKSFLVAALSRRFLRRALHKDAHIRKGGARNSIDYQNWHPRTRSLSVLEKKRESRTAAKEPHTPLLLLWSSCCFFIASFFSVSSSPSPLHHQMYTLTCLCLVYFRPLLLPPLSSLSSTVYFFCNRIQPSVFTCAPFPVSVYFLLFSTPRCYQTARVKSSIDHHHHHKLLLPQNVTFPNSSSDAFSFSLQLHSFFQYKKVLLFLYALIRPRRLCAWWSEVGTSLTALHGSLYK